MTEHNPKKVLSSARKHSEKVSLFGDMIFSLMTIPLALGYLDQWVTDPRSNALSVALFSTFAVMGLSRVFRAFRIRKKGIPTFVSQLFFGLLFLAGAAIALAFGFTEEVRIFLGLSFWASMLTERVLSIIRNQSFRNVLLNVLFILLIVSYAVALFMPLEIDYFVLVIQFSAFHAFLSIMIVIFSNVKLDILKQIVRKTYATEIILGLLLLILAFSYILSFMDESIDSFQDALWYCFTIVTTIGLGDVRPSTLFGRTLSVILGIYGIIVVALITSIIVNFYGEMKKIRAEDPPEEDTDPPEANATPPVANAGSDVSTADPGADASR